MNNELVIENDLSLEIKHYWQGVLLGMAVGLLLLAAVPSLFAYDNDRSANASKDFTPVYHISDQVDLISTLKFTYTKPKITVKSVFPQLEGDQENIESFNQLVTELVQQEITDFQHEVTFSQAQRTDLPANAKNDLYIDFDSSVIKSNQNHIMSFRFAIQGYIGGEKHPYNFHRVLNYDLENNAKIELNELFKPNTNYLVVLSNYTRQVLFKRLENMEMVLIGTGANEENFRNWNLKPNGLFITFDNSQLSPSVHGTQTVLVPYSVLKQMLSPNSPIAYCVKNKKACARNNLLTGGFIDEAVNTRDRTLNPILSKR